MLLPPKDRTCEVQSFGCTGLQLYICRVSCLPAESTSQSGSWMRAQSIAKLMHGSLHPTLEMSCLDVIFKGFLKRILQIWHTLLHKMHTVKGNCQAHWFSRFPKVLWLCHPLSTTQHDSLGEVRTKSYAQFPGVSLQPFNPVYKFFHGLLQI